MVYFESTSLKVHTVDGYPFLIVEPMGNLILEAYQQVLSQEEIALALQHCRYTGIYLELNGIWTVGTEQQEWTVGPFQARMQGLGVTKMAIGLAEHVYPTFAVLAGMYENKALIPTRYFADLPEMAAWLR